MNYTAGHDPTQPQPQMPTAHWLATQKENKDRERWMGNLDAKWEAAELEEERLDKRWCLMVRQGNAAMEPLDADPTAPLDDVAVCVPTEEELAIALAWLDKDEPEYSDGAATELIGNHEATLLLHAPGASPLTVAMGSAGKALFVVLAGVDATARRVLGLLVTRESGGVDFIVTAFAARGKGVAAAAVTRFIQPALSARGVKVDEVESLPSAVRFWSKLGYRVVPKEPVAAPDDASMRIKTPAALERARKRCAFCRCLPSLFALFLVRFLSVSAAHLSVDSDGTGRSANPSRCDLLCHHDPKPRNTFSPPPPGFVTLATEALI